MKKIRVFAIATVLTFGIGGAVTASMMAEEPANVMNIAEEGQPEQWVDITPGHQGCDDADLERRCTGYQADENSPVQNREFGYPIP